MTEEERQELEHLRRWKAEALEVITAWDACYEDLESWGISAKLGEMKAHFVRRWIRKTLLKQESKK